MWEQFSFSITVFQAGSQGDYQVMVRNASGTAASTPCALVLYSGLQFDSTAINVTNGSIQFRLVGLPSTNYVIEASMDFIHWVPLATNCPATGLWRFTDPQSVGPCRFYRAVPQ